MFRHLLGHDRTLRSFRHAVRAPSRRQRSCRPRLERLEDRLAPAQYVWTGDVGPFWSSNENWESSEGGRHAPYGDPSAELVFPSSRPYRDTVHDFTGPTTLQ